MYLSAIGHQLDHVMFIFNARGQIIDVKVQVSYSIQDTVTGESVASPDKVFSIISGMSPDISRAEINAFAQKVRDLALG